MAGRTMVVWGSWLGVAAALQPMGAVAQEAGPVEVDLRVEAGHLVVPVAAGDGRTLDFVIGSGSGVTLLSESAAGQLGDSPSLTLGGIPLVMGGAVTVPDDYLSAGGATFAGKVGANTLNEFDLLVDAPGGRMVLKPIGPRVEWPGVALSDPLRMQVYHGVALTFAAQVNGTAYRASLDLGTPFSVVNEGLRKEQSLEPDDTATLAMAGARLEDHPVRTLDLEVLQRWSPDGAPFILIGAPLAWDCAVSISWVHQEIRTCVR